MKNKNTALGFYQNHITATSVLKKLRKQGFKHSASIQHTHHEDILVKQYSASPILTISVLISIIATIALTLFIPAIQPFVLSILLILIPLLAWILYSERFYKIDSRTINSYKNCVIRDEALVIVQVQDKHVRSALTILREVPSGHPTSFLVRSGNVQGSIHEQYKEPLSLTDLQEHAKDLAFSLKNCGFIESPVNTLQKKLQKCARSLEDTRHNVAEATYIEQNVTRSADWLIDNTHVIQGAIEEVQRNLPNRYYQELPKILDGTLAKLPRIYLIALEFVESTENKVNRENISIFLNSYLSIDQLTIGELWAFPLMLKLVLIEHLQQLGVQLERRLREGELANYWGNRLLNVAKKEPSKLEFFFKTLTDQESTPSPHFAEELIEHLYDEESILPLVKSWVEEKLGIHIEEIVQKEQMQETLNEMAFSSGVISLITLSQLSWKDIFESISPVDKLLQKDPAEIYSKMNFETRDAYRHSIEMLSRHSRNSEKVVTETVLEMANQGQDDVTRHVGYYLIDAGRPQLENALSYHPTLQQTLRRWVQKHSSNLYLGSITFITILVEIVVVLISSRFGASSFQTAILAILALIPASEIGIQLINFIIPHFLSPFILPKLFFDQGIPEKYKSLIVIPSMLLTPESIEAVIHKLEIHYLANLDPSLKFSLFFDFADAPEQKMKEDEGLVEKAIQGIKGLDEKYGGNRFFLFLRDRVWSPSESAWIGWERKRGKLECLNRFLIDPSFSPAILRFGKQEDLNHTQFVITLDADTQLPKDRAKLLVETIAHPLNSPLLSQNRSIERGYTIIQPRVGTDISQPMSTYFSRIFSDTIGVNPYTQAVSDVFQDLMREGTYHGKGIYDVKAFDHVLSGRYPDEHILSHDLLEGAYVRVGYASDISLFDQFPADYHAWSKRQERWMRGDWQIIDWLFASVPNEDRQLQPNPLSWINRWKIFDNLRRILLLPMLLLLFLGAWMFTPHAGIWTTLGLIVLFLPIWPILFSHSFFRSITISWKEFLKSILRVIITIALIPHQVFLSMVTFFRVFYRRKVHRNLLEWSVHAQQGQPLVHTHFILAMGAITLASLALSIWIYLYNPATLPWALPFCILWAISPYLVKVLDDPILLSERSKQKIPLEEQTYLRNAARKTWRFFDDFVGPQSNWLPPDNYQTALSVEIAQRTSPTNIGLWMLSAISAYDLKYITCDEVINRLSETFQSLNKLELFEGHLLNWYDIQYLQPLYPRYVSTVDNGNLIACLWALEQAINQLISSPVLPNTYLEGLKDIFEMIANERLDPIKNKTLLDLQTDLSSSPNNLLTLIQMRKKIEGLVNQLEFENIDFDNEEKYWIKQFSKELFAWDMCIKRYLEWVEILNEVSDLQLEELEINAPKWREEIFLAKPSLESLASGNVSPAFTKLIELFLSKNDLPETFKSWSIRLFEAFHKAQWLAGEKVNAAKKIINEAIKISESTNMQFLYDKDRKLFSIGYHVDNRKLDASFYDLLASEARIASLISIAKGEVPVEHWWTLGRPFKLVSDMRVLASWGGTMFEYLMPLLLTKHFPNSLLGDACESAVACQILYGTYRGIPWGISEAAFSEIDSRKTYQYRSFGVPGLGLKRGLDEDLVVSPYSSALALAINPLEAVKNLRRLGSNLFSMDDTYGYYESIDFSRQRGPHGERGIIVYAYMAHHQGMSLIAINNVLNDQCMVNRFHADPRISGIESLLYERIPLNPAIAKGHRKETPPTRLMPFSSIPIMGVMDTPHSTVPKVNLLSNGVYSIMVTNSGGGYSKWKEIALTRWRSDTTCDGWGSFCYIKDLQSGVFWSTTYQPTFTKGQNFSVKFKADKVEFRRLDNQIETFTEIVVSPQDNAEIRLLTLANLSKNTRHIELTSYSELVLAPHNADRAHPAFNKLFIQTESLPSVPGIIAFRRLRSKDEKPIWAGHVISCDQLSDEPLQFETDRNLFIGRGYTLSNPKAMREELNRSEGYVLDPIFSLRRSIHLKPGQRVQVAFITAVADDKETLIEIMKRYSELSAVHRALEMAWTHAQLELRHLRIHQEDAQLFQKLASRILYPHSHLRLSPERLRRNRLGQSRLWAYSISGDLPIVAVTLGEIHEVELLKQVLAAHAFWRLRGLQVDLVVLNEEATGYEHPLFELINKIIHSQVSHGTEIEKLSGGVYVINCDQTPEEDILLILSVARAHLVAARGFLRQHMVAPMEAISYPSRLHINRKIKEDPSPPLPFLELAYFNGIGGFTLDGKEYAIYLDSKTQTPAPWINVIANPQFGVIASEAGLGCTWYGNSQTNRLTTWSNDPLLNPISDVIYIRDDETGTFWTPTPAPIREMDPYRTRHGQGYSLYEHNSHGIEQELLVFVPLDDQGGEPICVQRLRLINTSSRKRKLSIFSYTEIVMGTNREETQMHVYTKWDPESQALFAYNPYNPDYGNSILFISSSTFAASYTGNRTEFIGRNHPGSDPTAMKRASLSNMIGASLDPCVALQVEVELEPGEKKEIAFVLGYAQDENTARKLAVHSKDLNWLEASFRKTQEWWNKLLGKVQVETPEMFINFALNRWLLYQNLSCRIWGRTAFYQSSGAYGFRDQLQDVLALLHTYPKAAKEQILKAASRQFIEGDVQHWWLPPTNGGVRTKISDDLLWLPFVTAQYVRVTKDLSILQEVISFIKGDLLKEDQHEAFFIPEISSETGTLLEHCRRSIHKSLPTGSHGLPLIGGGDWNDGMNNVGILGKGESVWLAWFLVHVMNDFAYLLIENGQIEEGEGFKVQAKRLASEIESNGWDGEWYRRAYYDDGTPLGSKVNIEDKIDALPQAWAVIAEAADPERCLLAMQAVEKHLILKNERLVLLLNPPFDHTSEDPGYIKGYPPGVRENGGQYTHGSLWVPMAFARMGEGDKAQELLQMMHPVMHTLMKDDLSRYKLEPYVTPGDVYYLKGKEGQGGWSWYTGSCGWMYRIWLEEVLGFCLRGDQLTFDPAFPKKWSSVKMHYLYHLTRYEIQFENPQHVEKGKISVELDGKQVEKNVIQLIDDGQTHHVRVILFPG